MADRITTVHSLLLIFIFILSCSKSEVSKSSNHLVDEKSPYLLHHADNPIDWFPWKNEALDKAQIENKLMIISIGYFSCHWCQVMEEETFTDTLVANVMNEYFVSIKVDREERPDIDAVYTAAAEAMIGRSGWPLNVIATPTGEPLFIGTYFENKEWRSIIERAAYLYEDNPEQLKKEAGQYIDRIGQINRAETENDIKFNPDSITQKILESIDKQWGGLNSEQKFPNAPLLNSLIDFTYYYPNKSLDKELIHYLDQLIYGGVNDHINGGFFRYSTNRQWQIPHFEKMLYDNAQLISTYSRAFQKFDDPRYLASAEATFKFLKENFRSPNGLYYTSSNATSNNEEGGYYSFTTEELNRLQLSDSTRELFNINDAGNWQTSKSILYSSKNKAELYSAWKQSADYQKLRNALKERVSPDLDVKTLTAWNAMLVTGLLDLYKVTSNSQYLKEARDLLLSLVQSRVKKSQYVTRQERKESVYFLEDYAFLIDALIHMYQITLNENDLKLAKDLTKKSLELFLVDGWFKLSTDLALQSGLNISSSDLSIPSSNAIMAQNLFKLGTYYYDEHDQWKTLSTELTLRELDRVNKNPVFKGSWLQNMAGIEHEPFEVAILGEKAQQLIVAFNQKSYRPDILYMGGNSEGSIPLLENKYIDGRNMIYVCENKTCRLPTPDVEVAYQLTLK